MELLKVTGIKYEFKRGAKGVRLVCLKLSSIDPDTSQIQGWNITIKCVLIAPMSLLLTTVTS